jgi:hypothetical protein
MKKITAMVAGISLAFTLSATSANAGFLDSVKSKLSGSSTLSSMLTKGKGLIKEHGPDLLSAGASMVAPYLTGFLGNGDTSSKSSKNKKK